MLDSAHAEPGPEQQPVSKNARTVESAAATAAAVLGVLLSDHENVTLGGGAPIDENKLFEDTPNRNQRAGQSGAKKPEDAPATAAPDEPLVPWVRLK